MVDALEAILLRVGQDADLRQLVSNRIAARHKYGLPSGGWTGGEDGQDAFTLTPVPGQSPDLTAGMSLMRLEARAYGATTKRAWLVMAAVQALMDTFQRCVVTLGAGERALIYYLVPDDAPEVGFDTDIRMEFVRLPLRASVASEPVEG